MKRIPAKIVSMVRTRQNKGQNSKKIAAAINDSATAKNLKVEYTHRSIAAIMANLTMGKYQ